MFFLSSENKYTWVENPGEGVAQILALGVKAFWKNCLGTGVPLFWLLLNFYFEVFWKLAWGVGVGEGLFHPPSSPHPLCVFMLYFYSTFLCSPGNEFLIWPSYLCLPCGSFSV
jgi:hypothetical protein